MLETLTTLPCPEARRCGASCRVSEKGAVRLRASAIAKASSVCSSKGTAYPGTPEVPVNAALLTRTSQAPRPRTTSTTREIPCGSRRSAATGTWSLPGSAAAAAAQLSSSRSTTTMRAPALARASASTRPSGPAPPVTTAVRPVSDVVGVGVIVGPPSGRSGRRRRATQRDEPGADEGLDEAELVLVVDGEGLGLGDLEPFVRSLVEPRALEAAHEVGPPEVEVAVDPEEPADVLPSGDTRARLEVAGERAVEGPVGAHADPHRVEGGFGDADDAVEGGRRGEASDGLGQLGRHPGGTRRVEEEHRVVGTSLVALDPLEGMTHDRGHGGVVGRELGRAQERGFSTVGAHDVGDLGRVGRHDAAGDLRRHRRSTDAVGDEGQAPHRTDVLAG